MWPFKRQPLLDDETARWHRAVKFLIAFSLVATLSMIPMLGVTSDQCMAGRKKSLMDAHFSGPIMCSSKDATFVLVGRTSGNGLSIYDYRYRFLSQPEGVYHGGQRMVIFRGNTYVGQYALSPPPYLSISVQGSRVKLKSRDLPKRTSLDFSKGPPSKIFSNGEVLELFR